MSLEGEFTRTNSVSEAGQDVASFDAPDLSPQDHAEHTANLVARAFESTELFEVIEVKAGVGQFHLMGRVEQTDERRFVRLIVGPCLRATSNGKCDTFIGKQFLLKNDRTRYAWVFSFASNDLLAAAHSICDAIEPATQHLEVTESPLMGPGTPQSGGQISGRKGASPIG